jgi:hypothetical protein
MKGKRYAEDLLSGSDGHCLGPRSVQDLRYVRREPVARKVALRNIGATDFASSVRAR